MCMNYHCEADSEEDKEAAKCYYVEAYARECAMLNVVVDWRSVNTCRK